MKTNAARILDGLGIRYELREYDVDEADLSAESVAHKVGLPPEQVFKTPPDCPEIATSRSSRCARSSRSPATSGEA
jgi:hypothetical protein